MKMQEVGHGLVWLLPCQSLKTTFEPGDGHLGAVGGKGQHHVTILERKKNISIVGNIF
jgi:hypothetical protein